MASAMPHMTFRTSVLELRGARWFCRPDTPLDALDPTQPRPRSGVNLIPRRCSSCRTIQIWLRQMQQPFGDRPPDLAPDWRQSSAFEYPFRVG